MTINLKRGLIRLWIVIACVVDAYIVLMVGLSIKDGFPLGTTWSVFFLLLIAAHVLWFSALAAILWVLNGFSQPST